MMRLRGMQLAGALARGWRCRLERCLARLGRRLKAWPGGAPRRVANGRVIAAHSLRWALSGLALSLVATCGQKGPLYLPEEEESNAAALVQFAALPSASQRMAAS